MEFSLEDIALLYGEEFYLLPDYPAGDVAAVPVSVVSGEPVEAEVLPAQPVAPPAEKPKLPEKQPVALPVQMPEKAAPPAIPPVVASEAPLAPGLPPASPVSWKLRPTSRFALVMTEAEFSRKLLTSTLRVFVESAKIPLEQTGFGVIPSNSSNWAVADAPVNVIVMLTPRPEHWQTPPGKTVLFADTLTAIVADPAKEQQLTAMMQEVLRAIV